MSDGPTFHVIFGTAGAGCNWSLELDTSKARPVSDVPEEQRCKRQGCGTEWGKPRPVGELAAAPAGRRRRR